VSENLSLLDRILHRVESGELALPVFNAAAGKLQALSVREDADPREVTQLILADQVLVAEVLRAANSSFFGGLAQINTVRSAIVRLGLRQVAQLAVLASHRSEYDARNRLLREMIERLWPHASATAMASGWLVRRLGFGRELESEAFVGGLLHDVGKLVILRAIDEIKTAEKGPFDLSAELINEILDAAHCSVGFSFLKRWDIPSVYCEIARDHHAAEFHPSKIPLISVRLANNAAAKMGISLKPNPNIILSALPEAQCLNANDILLAELEIMMEDSLVAVR